jgi:Fic family protein
LEWGCQQLATRPISVNLILGLHERLLQGVRGQPSAGRFKDRQNHIGSHPTAAIEEAVFVPPPPDRIVGLIGDLERYINRDNRGPKVVQCALAHYQFETIHPFNDGNGRVGRLLIILQLIQLGLLSAPLIYPSVYFERARDDYYRRLQAVRDSGAWESWIHFFVQGIRQQCGETIQFTRVILALRQQIREQVSGVTRRAAVNEVLDALFIEPVLTVREIVDRTSMSTNTAQAALNELIARALVYEVTGRQKGRSYACAPVLDAVFGRSSVATTQS